MNYLKRLFDDIVPTLIKISAVLVSAPRLIIAILRSEGIELPHEWLVWWIPSSALFAVGLAVIEGFAFSYILSRFKDEKNKDRSRNIFIFAVISLLTFSLTIGPSIVASVMEISLKEVFSNPIAASPLLWFWSFMVVLSSVLIVASVGYSQKSEGDKKYKSAKTNETYPNGIKKQRGRRKKVKSDGVERES